MIYEPSIRELITIAERLKIPVIYPKVIHSALIDAYADFCDVEYEDILNDIEAGYLTYHETKPEDAEVICSDSKVGYLWYYDGDYETLIPIQ